MLLFLSNNNNSNQLQLFNNKERSYIKGVRAYVCIRLTTIWQHVVCLSVLKKKQNKQNKNMLKNLTKKYAKNFFIIHKHKIVKLIIIKTKKYIKFLKLSNI